MTGILGFSIWVGDGAKLEEDFGYSLIMDQLKPNGHVLFVDKPTLSYLKGTTLGDFPDDKYVNHTKQPLALRQLTSEKGERKSVSLYEAMRAVGIQFESIEECIARVAGRNAEYNSIADRLNSMYLKAYAINSTPLLVSFTDSLRFLISHDPKFDTSAFFYSDLDMRIADGAQPNIPEFDSENGVDLRYGVIGRSRKQYPGTSMPAFSSHTKALLKHMLQHSPLIDFCDMHIGLTTELVCIKTDSIMALTTVKMNLERFDILCIDKFHDLLSDARYSLGDIMSGKMDIDTMILLGAYDQARLLGVPSQDDSRVAGMTSDGVRLPIAQLMRVITHLLDGITTFSPVFDKLREVVASWQNDIEHVRSNAEHTRNELLILAERLNTLSSDIKSAILDSMGVSSIEQLRKNLPEGLVDLQEYVRWAYDRILTIKYSESPYCDGNYQGWKDIKTWREALLAGNISTYEANKWVDEIVLDASDYNVKSRKPMFSWVPESVLHAISNAHASTQMDDVHHDARRISIAVSDIDSEEEALSQQLSNAFVSAKEGAELSH